MPIQEISASNMQGNIPLRNKKIAFITCGYPLDVSTMLINSLALLHEANEVEIIVSPFDSRHDKCPDWMQRLFVPAPPVSRNFFYRVVRRLCREVAALIEKKYDTLAWWLKHADLFRFSLWFKQHAETARYDMVIAVECHALIAASSAIGMGCDLLYYNMELLDWSAENPLYEDKILLKKLEYTALRPVAHVFITSPNRVRIFSEINNYPLEKISVLPVVPRKITFTTRSSFFRDLFAIPEDKYIVCYSGNFMPWAQCLEIIESMASWPEEAVLVMHTWNEQTLQSKYFQQMQAAAQGRPVYFSSRYLAYSDLAYALSSADVGMLYYEAIDANFTEIMFSSNKFGEYMAAGLPVICSPFPSLMEFVTIHNIGCAAPIQEIGSTLQRIIGDLDGYRMRVAACRVKYFEFEKYFSDAFNVYLQSRMVAGGAS